MNKGSLICILFFTGIGVALGAAFDQLAIGLALGAGVGFAICRYWNSGKDKTE